MGCDIHSYVEVRRGGLWVYDHGEEYTAGELTEGPFGWRDYGIFGFLADVRNYSRSPVIAEPRGLPDDVTTETWQAYSKLAPDAHSASWLAVAELAAYDYDKVFWDRRVTKQIGPYAYDGAALAEKGEGRHLTLRDFLGPEFFAELDELAKLGDTADIRLIFWFDN